MIGLLLKDWFELKKLWLQPKFLVTSIISIGAGMIFFSSNTILISIFVSIFFINTIQTLFVSDKKSGWNLFVQTTHISSSKMVQARYLMSVIVCLAMTFFNTSISLILWLFYQQLSLKEYLILSLIFLAITLMYVFIMLPFFYGFDENGLTIGILLCISLAFLVSRIPELSTNLIGYLQSITASQLTIIGVSMLFLLSILSFLSSVLIFKRKG